MNTEKEVCRALLGVVSVATGAISAVPAKATVHVEAPLCGCFPRLTRSRRVASFNFDEEVEGGPSSGSYLSRTAALDMQRLLQFSVSNVFSAEVKVCVLGRRQKLVVCTDLAHFMDELAGHGSAQGFVLKVREGELSLELLQQRQESQLEEASELDQLMTDGTANGHELNDSNNDDAHCDNDEDEAGNEAVEVHETHSEEYDDDKEWEAIKNDIEQYFNDTEWSPSEGRLEQYDGAECSPSEKELEAYNDFAEWDHSEEELQPCVSDAELDTNGKELVPFTDFLEWEHREEELEPRVNDGEVDTWEEGLVDNDDDGARGASDGASVRGSSTSEPHPPPPPLGWLLGWLSHALSHGNNTTDPPPPPPPTTEAWPYRQHPQAVNTQELPPPPPPSSWLLHPPPLASRHARVLPAPTLAPLPSQGREDTTTPSAPTSPDPPHCPLWNDFLIVAGAIRLVGEFV